MTAENNLRYKFGDSSFASVLGDVSQQEKFLGFIRSRHTRRCPLMPDLAALPASRAMSGPPARLAVDDARIITCHQYRNDARQIS